MKDLSLTVYHGLQVILRKQDTDGQTDQVMTISPTHYMPGYKKLWCNSRYMRKETDIFNILNNIDILYGTLINIIPLIRLVVHIVTSFVPLWLQVL